MLVETDNPEIPALELFQGAHQVDHAGDAQVLGRTGAGLDRHGAQGRGTALGEHHAIHPGAIGHAQQGAQVLRVLDAIQGQDEASGAGRGGGRRVEIFYGEKFLRFDQRHYALVSGRLGQQRKLLARLLAHSDPGLAADGDQPLQAVVLALAGHQHVVETPPSGLERFLHRVNAVENFHED